MEAGGFLPADADYGEPGPEEGEESEPSTRLPVHAPRPTPFVGCELCPNLTFNPEWAAAYGVALCACCTGRDHLISKTNAKELYLVSDLDLKGLGAIERTNPRGMAFAPMRLYLESQVAAVAARKHGPDADLDALRAARADGRAARKVAKRRAEAEAGGKEEARLARARARLDAQRAGVAVVPARVRARQGAGGGEGPAVEVEII